MKKAVIVCNGQVNSNYLFSHIHKNDFLIAVDGGANKLLKTNFSPSVIIGDMDSINKSALKKFKNSKKIVFPKEKDELDLELALNFCVEKKFKEISILGAIGSRVDMSLANVFLLSQIPENVNAKIIHENQEIFLIEKKQVIVGVPGEKISFFPINGNVNSLNLKGFKYEVKNLKLKFGTGMGISNEFKSKKTLVSFKDGLLLCVHFRSWL